MQDHIPIKLGKGENVAQSEPVLPPVPDPFKFSKKNRFWDQLDCTRLVDGVPFPPLTVCIQDRFNMYWIY